jgi:hypothetical protein
MGKRGLTPRTEGYSHRELWVSSDNEDGSGSDSESEGDNATIFERLSFGARTKVGLSIEENIDSACALAVTQLNLRKVNLFRCKFGNLIHLFGLTGLLVASMYTQMVLAVYVIPLISLDEYGEKLEVEGIGNLFGQWRRSPVRGAAPVAGMQGETHADLACTERQWSWEEDVIDDLGKYRKKMTFFMMIPTGTGHFLGIMVLSIWVCTAIVQLRSWAGFVLLLFLPEYLTEEAMDNVVESRKSWRVMRGFKKKQAKATVVAVALARGALIILVARSGMVFLARTDNLNDFILNSVALAFVFELPVLLYKAFAYPDTQQDLKSISTKFEDSKVRLAIPAWVIYSSGPVSVVTALALFRTGYAVLVEFGDQLEFDVYGALCNASVAGA